LDGFRLDLKLQNIIVTSSEVYYDPPGPGSNWEGTGLSHINELTFEYAGPSGTWTCPLIGNALYPIESWEYPEVSNLKLKKAVVHWG